MWRCVCASPDLYRQDYITFCVECCRFWGYSSQFKTFVLVIVVANVRVWLTLLKTDGPVGMNLENG